VVDLHQEGRSAFAAIAAVAEAGGFEPLHLVAAPDPVRSPAGTLAKTMAGAPETRWQIRQ
jgi:hypothetical protein